MTSRNNQELIAAALAARQNAHAPYSNFEVGAAVLGEDGGIWAGANVENASFGLTMCAERVALASAVSAGQRRISRLAVATPGGHAPCGGCRQFAAEFSDEMLVLLIDSQRPESVTEVALAELLPMSFQYPDAPQRR